MTSQFVAPLGLIAVVVVSACSEHRGLAKRATCRGAECGAQAADGVTAEAGSAAGAPIATGRPMQMQAPAKLPDPGGDAGEIIKTIADDAQVVFDPNRIQTYRISVPEEDLARLDAQPSTEEYASATLSFGEENHASIGFRYKGSSGAFLQPCTESTTPGRSNGPKAGKCSIKLAFDYADEDGRFHGLKKLNLHSMGRDHSLLRERLGYEMFREMGVASPRVAYARVEINGKLEGLFLAVEQIDGRFTRARFSEGGEGNLYKEVWPVSDDPASYRVALESNKGDDTDVSKMLAFAAAIKRDPQAALDWIDLDYTMRYIAVDRVLMNDDGAFHWYCNGLFQSATNHNYYWYEAERAGRVWIVPWDLDGALGNEPRVFIDVDWSGPAICMCHVAVGFPQRAPQCDPLIAALANHRAEYTARVDEFLAGPFEKKAVDARLDAWSAQIKDVVADTAELNGAPSVEGWGYAVDELRGIIERQRDNRGFPYGL